MRHRFVLLVAVSAAVLAAPVRAQEPALPADTLPVADTIPSEAPSPRAAFVRGLLVPGWGHAYSGEYARGAVYVSLQGSSWFMLVKTLRRLGDAKEREGRLKVLARDSLAVEIAADTMLARVLMDPVLYEQALLTYPGLRNTRGLVNARKQQRQDWITYTLFFTFAASVDAYVTAHLKDFPGDITASPADGGGMTLRVQLPVGGRK